MDDPHAPSSGRWARQWLGDRSMTIAGGTSEVQRNIVAQRILGLPRDRGETKAKPA
jgi:alkylation response protein AidB-like acyl-CoA dehydrogenase